MRYTILIVIIVALGVAACTPAATPTQTPLPTAEPTLVPTRTPFILRTLPPTKAPTLPPEIAAEATAASANETLFINPLLGRGIEPPMAIDLPEGWQFGYDTFVYQDVFSTQENLTYVPFALYRGPVTGGTGEIILLWNLPSITTGIELSPDFNRPNMWMDGLRLLHLLVMNGCVVNTGPERTTYQIGDLPAAGTDFTAVACGPDIPDTRGWFAGVRVDETNFIFYVYTDPLEAINGPAEAELQAILDSIVIDLEGFTFDLFGDLDLETTPEATPDITPESTE